MTPLFWLFIKINLYEKDFLCGLDGDGSYDDGLPTV